METIQIHENWVKKSRWKLKKFFETNENGNTTYQNLWNTAKAVLRENFVAINTYIKKKKKKISNKQSNMHPKKPEKEEQTQN